MFTYLIQASSCLIILYGVYHFILSELTFFKYNRAYLILAIIVSVSIPFLAPLLEIPRDLGPEMIKWQYVASEVYLVNINPTRETSFLSSIIPFLWMFYGIGVVFVLTKIGYGLLKIYNYYRSGQKEFKNDITFITTQEIHLPFSFFHWVFVSQWIPLENHIQTVLDHEKVHVRQWHTIDVLFTELIHAFFWFNPILIFYKRALRQSHEYLADEVICKNDSVSSYTELLLSKSNSEMEMALANHFFHSQIKNRITMMYTKKSNKKSMWKYLVMFPVLIALAFVFTSSKEKTTFVKSDTKIVHDTLPVSEMQKNLDNIQTINVREDRVDIRLKDGKSETYNMKNKSEKQAFEAKYGELPPPPPSPPAPMKSPPSPPSPPKFEYNDNISMINISDKTIEVTLKDGTFESYKLNDKAEKKAFESKYGTLPPLPPPPAPPVPRFIILKNGPNAQGYILSVADNHGECVIIIKDKANKIVKAMQLTEWNKNEKANIAKYGEIPPPPPSASEPPKVPSPASYKSEELFGIVEDMPRFPGCEDEKDNLVRETCAKQKMLDFIYSNLLYPEDAKNKKIEGNCVAQFEINIDGSMENVRIIRDIGGGCGDAVLTILDKMNAMPQKWIPGHQRGKPVKTLYTIPVQFKL